MDVLKILTHKPVVFASMVLSIVFVICGRTRKETPNLNMNGRQSRSVDHQLFLKRKRYNFGTVHDSFLFNLI